MIIKLNQSEKETKVLKSPKENDIISKTPYFQKLYNFEHMNVWQFCWFPQTYILRLWFLNLEHIWCLNCYRFFFLFLRLRKKHLIWMTSFFLFIENHNLYSLFAPFHFVSNQNFTRTSRTQNRLLLWLKDTNFKSIFWLINQNHILN